MTPEQWTALVVPLAAAVVSVWTLLVRTRDRREAREQAASSKQSAATAQLHAEEAKTRIDYLKEVISAHKQLNDQLAGEVSRVRDRLEKEVAWLDGQLRDAKERNRLCDENRLKDLERIHQLELKLIELQAQAKQPPPSSLPSHVAVTVAPQTPPTSPPPPPG